MHVHLLVACIQCFKTDGFRDCSHGDLQDNMFASIISSILPPRLSLVKCPQDFPRCDAVQVKRQALYLIPSCVAKSSGDSKARRRAIARPVSVAYSEGL